MKFSDFSTESNAAKASDLVQEYAAVVRAGIPLAKWLAGFDFGSREEIEKAIRDLYTAIVFDGYVSRFDIRKGDNLMRTIYKKAEALVDYEGRLDKFAVTTSGELWHNHFAPLKRKEALDKMFGGKADKDKYNEAYDRIMEVYSLTMEDMEKIHFFVEMVKARDAFPPSMRRMLYIWGKAKNTGKTTCAKMITATLNGSDRWQDAEANYATNLATEMQIGSFRVPKIATANCCMMDECFYQDMGKTYHDFKRFLTSSGGSARLPYGQEFAWEGLPNYVATSNEPLKAFIKDWGDRRFLSVEFKAQPTEKMTFKQIHDLWKQFIVNSVPATDDWQQWSEWVAKYSDEEGERQTFAEEYAVELQKPDFLNTLLNVPSGRSATSPDNKLTLKFFVSYFAEKDGYDAAKHRREIEQAVIEVFGERWNGYNFWRADILKDKASTMLYGAAGSDGLPW